jgi:acetolactate synthase-1/2/3 large subunit
VAYAAAYGAQGLRVARSQDLLPCLESSLRSPGVKLIDVQVDYSENRILTREIEQSLT